jgi:hypothetical protein
MHVRSLLVALIGRYSPARLVFGCTAPAHSAKLAP